MGKPMPMLEWTAAANPTMTVWVITVGRETLSSMVMHRIFGSGAATDHSFCRIKKAFTAVPFASDSQSKEKAVMSTGAEGIAL